MIPNALPAIILSTQRAAELPWLNHTRSERRNTMKRFALLPALFALLLTAVLTGAAFAQQTPPGPTSRQAGDMIPDAITIAAFAARSATADSAAQARDTLLDTVAAFADKTATADSAAADSAAQARDTLLDTVAILADQTATAGSTAQAGDMIPDASTIAAFIARSSTADNTSRAGNMIPDAITIAAALTVPHRNSDQRGGAGDRKPLSWRHRTTTKRRQPCGIWCRLYGRRGAPRALGWRHRTSMTP